MLHVPPVLLVAASNASARSDADDGATLSVVNDVLSLTKRSPLLSTPEESRMSAPSHMCSRAADTGVKLYVLFSPAVTTCEKASYVAYGPEFTSTAVHPGGAPYVFPKPDVCPLFQKTTTSTSPAAGAAGHDTGIAAGAYSAPDVHCAIDGARTGVGGGVADPDGSNVLCDPEPLHEVSSPAMRSPNAAQFRPLITDVSRYVPAGETRTSAENPVAGDESVALCESAFGAESVCVTA